MLAEMRSEEAVFDSVAYLFQTARYDLRESFFVADFVHEFAARYEEFFAAAEVQFVDWTWISVSVDGLGLEYGGWMYRRYLLDVPNSPCCLRGQRRRYCPQQADLLGLELVPSYW